MFTRTRGYLPHTNVLDGTYSITIRLFDSLPQSVYHRYRQELELKQRLGTYDPLILWDDYQTKIEKYLDASYRKCWLRDPRIAKLAVDGFKKYDGQRYILHAYTIIPNHAHVLFSLQNVKPLGKVIGTWKGSSSFFANKMLQRSGIFWQREYFDRIVKSQRQFEYTIRYIFMNPVKAGLCADVFQWPWTGASPEIMYLLKRFFV